MRIRVLLIALAVALVTTAGIELWPWFPKDTPHWRQVPWPSEPGTAISLIARTNSNFATRAVLAATAMVSSSTVSWRQFQQEVTGIDHGDDWVWYCGTKDGYDYFRLEPSPLSPTASHHIYRVSVKSAPIVKRYQLTANSSNWVSWAQAAGLTHGLVWQR